MARTTLLNAWEPRMLSVLRIATGLLFLEHGTQKLLGFPPGGQGAPELMTLAGIGAVMELVGGALIVLGLFTRPVAFLLSGQMAVAYWMFHFKAANPYPVNNMGDAAILYCFVFLYLVFAGPGPWSIDGYFNRRRPLSVR
jgi:putative oxidoreductase